jgi:hypothetical protein
MQNSKKVQRAEISAAIAVALAAGADERSHRDLALAAAERRRAAVRAAWDDGMTYAAIGECLGVTRGRAEALARHRTDVAGRKAAR